jgi:hypothetical protein
MRLLVLLSYYSRLVFVITAAPDDTGLHRAKDSPISINTRTTAEGAAARYFI